MPTKRFAHTLAAGLLSLAFCVPVHGQPRGPIIQKLPPMPAQQRQFCAAYQEDTALRASDRAQSEEAKAKGPGNPLAERAAQHEFHDYERLFRAKQAEVMGNGSFNDWVAAVKIELNEISDQVFLSLSFQCKWREYGYRPNMLSDSIMPPYMVSHANDSLSFGSAFPNPSLSLYGIPANSDLGKSLAAVVQGETVIVSGRFFCAPPPSYVLSSHPATSFPTGGCSRNTDGTLLWATISSMTSVKSGTVWHFPMQRGNGVSFKRDYDYETFKALAKNAAASPLVEYLTVIWPQVLLPVGFRSGDTSLLVHVQGDIPSLIGRPPLQKPTAFPRYSRCYIVTPEDQTALENTAKHIDKILKSLFDISLGDAPVNVEPNPCIDANGNPRSSVPKV